MISDKKYRQLVNETYRMLFKEATPSADYDELLKNCCRYGDEENKIVFTEAPLSDEELRRRGWKKAIDFMSYYLDKERYQEIVESQAEKYKLKGYELSGFRTTMYLGWGPTSYKPKEGRENDGTSGD